MVATEICAGKRENWRYKEHYKGSKLMSGPDTEGDPLSLPPSVAIGQTGSRANN